MTEKQLLYGGAIHEAGIAAWQLQLPHCARLSLPPFHPSLTPPSHLSHTCVITGKTTMTEKLLLYGGAIHEAGEVKARASSRSATSDWMELEKARGISISSTAMTWQYNGERYR